jgi:2-keto-4-pentenoate hydratase
MSVSSPVWLDPRVAAGMNRQLATLDERLAGGESLVGWKLAFNTATAFERAGIDESVVGYFTDATVTDTERRIDLETLLNPMAEPELAVRMGEDVQDPTDLEAVAAAIGAVFPAFEISDFDPAEMDDLEGLLASDLYHRAMVFGPVPGARPGGDVSDLTVTVAASGGERYSVEPAAVLGELVDVVARTAAHLEYFGRRLGAGEIVMTGSVTPLVPVSEGSWVEFDAADLGTLRAEFGAG